MTSLKLSERQLNKLRPKPSESLVIHAHTNDGNIGWLLVNGRYLSNQEVEALERSIEAAREQLRVTCPSVGTSKCDNPILCRRAGCRLPSVWAALGEMG